MSQPARPPRQPYEPPLVRKVKLVPGEVAVAGCKSVRIINNVCKRGVQIISRTIGS
jgi:hypothetical protein